MKSSLALIVILFSISLIGHTAERIALVIGNSDYVEESVFGDIPVAEKDSELMASTLRALGFEVILARNASKTVMYNRLVDFETKIEEGGTALVYFAGHGIEYEKKNFLMGTNAKFLDRDLLGEESIEADTILKKVTGKAPKTAILLLDCCRQPPTNSWLRSLNKTRGASSLGLAELDVGPGLVVGFAASAGNLANDSLGGENGPYATSLTKHMKSGEELMRVMRLAARDVNRESIRMRKEHPDVEGLVVQEPAVYGQIYHDFYFSDAVKPGEPHPPAKKAPRLKSAAIVMTNYEYSNLPPLDLEEEADEIERLFGSHCDRILSLRNCDKTKLIEAISEESSLLKEERFERLYLYISGHGFHKTGRDYFVMNDVSFNGLSQPNATEKLLTHSEILQRVTGEKAPFSIVVLWDTARDEIGGDAHLYSGKEHLNTVSDNLVTVFSTMPGKTAVGGQPIGPFAKGVLNHFPKATTMIELFEGIKSTVIEETNTEKLRGFEQTPTFVGDSIVRFGL